MPKVTFVDLQQLALIKKNITRYTNTHAPLKSKPYQIYISRSSNKRSTFKSVTNKLQFDKQKPYILMTYCHHPKVSTSSSTTTSCKKIDKTYKCVANYKEERNRWKKSKKKKDRKTTRAI